MENNCPTCKTILEHIHKVIDTFTGYCPQCEKEFYLKPNGVWVTREEYKKFCDEFH